MTSNSAFPYIKKRYEKNLKIGHFKRHFYYGTQTGMIYHPDIGGPRGIGPLSGTHKLTKSAQSNEHAPKLIRGKDVGPSHYAPIAERQWDTENTTHLTHKALLVSNTKNTLACP